MPDPDRDKQQDPHPLLRSRASNRTARDEASKGRPAIQFARSSNRLDKNWEADNFSQWQQKSCSRLSVKNKEASSVSVVVHNFTQIICTTCQLIRSKQQIIWDQSNVCILIVVQIKQRHHSRMEAPNSCCTNLKR